MIKKAVLLCGGLATRLLPITKSIPKEMLPILSRPAIDYCIEDLKKNGITDILIILGRNKEVLENYYDRSIELEDRLTQNNNLEMLKLIETYKDINITFIRQIEAKGTGYATNLSRNFVGDESFILLYPDEIILDNSITFQLIQEHKKTGGNILPLKKLDNIKDCVKYGMVGTKQENNSTRITSFIEKPSIDKTPSNICFMGGGVFNSEIFKLLPQCITHTNGEQFLTDIFPYLIKNNSLYGVEIKGTRVDIGSSLGLIKANIIAGLQDNKIRNDLINFIQSLI